MTDITTLEGKLTATKGRFAIVVARFNSFVVESLVEGAIDALVRHGIDKSAITLVRVPGAWELPLATKQLLSKQQFDGVIALGAVIRGATPHFDYVCAECSKGIAQVSMETGVPVGFGVITTDTIEQAIERAGTKAGNKGADAALAVLEMANLYGQL